MTSAGLVGLQQMYNSALSQLEELPFVPSYLKTRRHIIFSITHENYFTLYCSSIIKLSQNSSRDI